ncbi:MAG: ribose-phosphate diphosphokinase [Candidatus Aenigmatarchaeota archaeon]
MTTSTSSNEFENMMFLATNESLGFATRTYNKLQERLEPAGIELPEIGHVYGAYFPGGKEIYPVIGTSVRNKRVYLFHHCLGYNGELDSNVGLVKVGLIGGALRNASPEQIIYVIPWFPYGRQDRLDRPRVPISAKWALKLLDDPDSKIKVRLVTYDMHAGQAQGFVDYQIDNLFSEPLMHEYLLRKFVLEDMNYRCDKMYPKELDDCNRVLREKVCIVSPDAGATTRARRLAKRFGGDLAVVDKRRVGGESEVMNILGSHYVNGKIAVEADDMIDTGGTMVNAADALRDVGATEVYGCGVHGLLSVDENGVPAEDKIRNAGMRIVVTSSIPRSAEYLERNRDILDQVYLDKFTADVLFEIQKQGGSVSKLFGEERPPRDDFRGVN